MPRRIPVKKKRSPSDKKAPVVCRYVTPAGRHCRRPRHEPLAVCSVHRQHDPRFVALDLAKAARRIMWTQDPKDICKKLVTFAQHGRIPPDIAEYMIYTAHVLADHDAKAEIEIWSHNIAQSAKGDSEHPPELIAPNPAQLEELRRMVENFGIAPNLDQPQAHAAVQEPTQNDAGADAPLESAAKDAKPDATAQKDATSSVAAAKVVSSNAAALQNPQTSTTVSPQTFDDSAKS